MKNQEFRVCMAQSMWNAIEDFGIRGAARELLSVAELPQGQVPAVASDDLEKAVITGKNMDGRHSAWLPMWALYQGGYNPYVYVPTFDIATNPTIMVDDPLEMSVWKIVSAIESQEDRYLRRMLDFAVQDSGQVARGDLSAHVLKKWSRNLRRYGGVQE